MAKLSEDERKQLSELEKRRTDEEEELKELEAKKKDEEGKARKALAKGDTEGAARHEDNVEIITASESSVHALIERLDRTEQLLIEIAKERGVPDAKIQEIRTRRIVGRR